MEKNLKNLTDHGIERAVIGTVLSLGRNSFIDISDVVDSKDFNMPLNGHIFSCVKALSEESCETFDTESIKAKAKVIGLGDIFDGKVPSEYLELITHSTFDQERLRGFAMQVKKLAICRDLYAQCDKTRAYLEDIKGSETLSEIISVSEGNITDFLNGLETNNKVDHIFAGFDEYLQKLLDEDVKETIGIPTGFPQWDHAIGGGPRPGSVHFIAARPKCGKSLCASNIALNVSSYGVPVLVLDSEMKKQDQQGRFICIDSGCPINLFETGKFKKDPKIKVNVLESRDKIKDLDIQYQSISGYSPDEIISHIRRWIYKKVGFNETGKANPCMIIYDYLKLTTEDGLGNNITETMLLGFAMTKLQNLAIKYEVPIIAFGQTSRAGIETEDTSIIAASDRILWFCSSMTILKNKDDADNDMGCGLELGNKKLIVLDTRHGPGLGDNDYINLKASIRPGVPETEATGKFKEGLLFSQRDYLGQIQNA